MPGYGELTHEAVKAVIAHFPELTSLHMARRRQLPDEAVETAAAHDPGLTSRDVERGRQPITKREGRGSALPGAHRLNVA